MGRVFLSGALFSVVATCATPNLLFEENVGQADKRARFLARTPQATVFLTDGGAVFSLRQKGSARSAAVHLQLAGAQAGRWRGEERSRVKISSFVGSREQWREAIPAFVRARRPDVYPGIDLVCYGKERQLEYDFELRPGADAQRIRLRFEGVHRLRLDAQGGLEIRTAAGVLTHQAPIVLQDGRRVEARYRLIGRRDAGIDLGPHDPARPLTIDPVVSFTSFYGGEGEDVITAASGASVAGYTNSALFPGSTVTGAGGYDAFFATYGNEERIAYIGGSGDDRAWAVYSNSDLEFAIGGETNSRDFPVFFWPNRLPSANSPDRIPQATYGGGARDGFVLFSSRNVLSSTYVGGSGDDRVLGVAPNLFSFSSVGETDSPDFPVTPNAPQPRLAGGRDGFVYAPENLRTYFGGSGDDSLTGIGGLIFGTTTSDDLPLANPLQDRRAGGTDAVLVAYDFLGNRLDLASYLGGSGDDRPQAIRDNAWMVGTTSSRDFPGGDPNSFRGGSDAFLCNFSIRPNARGVARTLFFGGSGNDEGRDVLTGDYLVLAGTTNSTDLPVREAPQSTYGGGASDAFYAVFDQNRELTFASYFGGAGAEDARGLLTDSQGRWILAGNATGGALDGAGRPGATAYAGSTDGFWMTFTPPGLRASARWAMKGTAAFGTVLPTALPGPPVTLRIRSLDPSRLLVQWPNQSTPESEISRPWDGSLAGFRLAGLESEGTAGLSVSADGLGELRLDVPLGAPRVVLQLTRLSSPIPVTSGEVRWPAGDSTRLLVSARMVGRVPGLDSDVAIVFPPDSLGHTLEFVSSDPEVFSIAPERIRFDGFIDLTGQTVRVGKTGTARVFARVTGPAGTLVSDTIDFIHEEPRLDLPPPFAAVGLVSSAQARVGANVPITVTSDNPDAVSLATSPSSPASASITLNGPIILYNLLGRTPGATANITASAPGYGSVTQPVAVAPAFYGFDTSAGRTQANPGALTSITVSLFNSRFATSGIAARAFSFRLTSSDPSVVEPVQESVTIEPGTGRTSFTLRAGQLGRARLELSGPPELEALNRQVDFIVVPADGGDLPIVIGRDLQTVLNLPATTTTVTSGDPTRLLVSTSSVEPGGASATGSQVWLQALAGEGEVPITIGGATPRSRIVRLVPSYAAMSLSGDYRRTLFAPLDFSVTTYAQSEAAMAYTFLPTGISSQVSSRLAQPLRPGLPPFAASIATSRADVGSITPSAGGPGLWYRFEPTSLGETTLTASVTGPVALSPRGRTARIIVQPVPLSVSAPARLGKDQSVPINLNPLLSGGFQRRGFRVRSGDPERLTVSTSASEPGAAEALTSSSVTLQPRADSGSVRLLVSGASEDSTIDFDLEPSFVSHWVRVPASAPSRTMVRIRRGEPVPLELEGRPAEVFLGLNNDGGYLDAVNSPRPGVSIPLQLTVEPAGALALSTAQVTLGQFNPLVSVSARRAGRAVVRVSAPAGVDVGPLTREIVFEATAPR